MIALKIARKLLIVDNQVSEQVQTLCVKLKRCDKSPESVLRIKVKYKILIFFFEDLLEFLGFLGLDGMLAVAWYFVFVRCIRLSSCNIAKTLRYFSLNSI